jgi:tetratricopeptide (TPR) repeat protein
MAIAWSVMTGCRTFHAPLEPTQNPALNGKERELSQALAHFVQGLVLEDSEGPLSPRTLKAYTDAAALAPAAPQPAGMAAVAALAQGRKDEAVTLFQAARRAAPTYQNKFDLAAIYQIAGRNEDAIREYQAACRMEPEQPGTYINIATIHFSEGRDEKAFRVLGQAIRHVKEDGQVIAFVYQQGMSLVREEAWQRAAGCFEFTAGHIPKERSRLWFIMARLYGIMGNKHDELAWMRRAARANTPPMPEAWAYWAQLQADADHSFKRGLRLLEQAERQFPDAITLQAAKVKMLADAGDTRAAADAMDRMMTLIDQGKPATAVNLYCGLSMFCEQRKMMEKSEAVLRRGLEKHPEAPLLLNALAYFLALQDRQLDEAQQLAEAALKADPENGAFLDTLGWIYFQKKMYGEALPVLKLAHEKEDPDDTIAEHLGDAYMALGKKEKAIEAWLESCRLNPKNTAAQEKLKAQGVAPEAADEKPPATEEVK